MHGKIDKLFVTCEHILSTNLQEVKTRRSAFHFYLPAAIMLFKNFEFGDYPPMARAYVKDSGTLDISRNNPRMEPQTIRLGP